MSQVSTAAAVRSDQFTSWVVDDVLTLGRLAALGCSRGTTNARVAAHRWQRFGAAVVLHGGPLTREQQWRVAVLNCGPRAALASFSSLQLLGLTSWERDEAHVLAPVGVPSPRALPFPVVLHRTSVPIETRLAGTVQAPADAAVLAAASFRSARPACGVLAAAVQQRLVGADELTAVLARSRRVRHRRHLRAAVADIAMGAEALSEIDFARLCRRHGLPEPVRQRVRPDPTGRRRYLDAEWTRRDGRRLVVEIDGALHLVARRWYDDQLRQNDVTLDGAMVLRYPSIVMRIEEAIVVDQLRRGLFGRW